MSHELRNPLNSILAQNIHKESLCLKIRNFLDTIETKDDIDDFQLNVKEPLLEYMTEMDDSLHVQKASASLMEFLV